MFDDVLTPTGFVRNLHRGRPRIEGGFTHVAIGLMASFWSRI